MSNDDDTRLDDIESKLAFQEDGLQQLNEALVAQQARIDQLEAMIRTLSGRLEESSGGDADPAPEPPPPHY